MTPCELHLATGFVAKFSFPSATPDSRRAAQLRRDLIRRRIWTAAYGGGRAYTLWCRLTLEDALALGLHRSMTDQFRRALVREYPDVPEELLGRRVFELETQLLARTAASTALPLCLSVFPRKKTMRSEDLTLNTRFRGGIVFGNLPQNRDLVQHYLDELTRHGIRAQVVEDEEDVVLRFQLSIADAFDMGYNRHAPDELRFALLDTFPELVAEEVRLEQRIRDLEQLYRRQRKAS